MAELITLREQEADLRRREEVLKEAQLQLELQKQQSLQTPPHPSLEELEKNDEFLLPANLESQPGPVQATNGDSSNSFTTLASTTTSQISPPFQADSQQSQPSPPPTHTTPTLLSPTNENAGAISNTLSSLREERNGENTIRNLSERSSEAPPPEGGKVSPLFQSKLLVSNSRYNTRTANPDDFEPRPSTSQIHTTTPKNVSKKRAAEAEADGSNPAKKVYSECKHCLKKFSRVSLYTKHVNSSNGCFLSRKNTGFWCSFCTRFFATEKDKKIHEKVHLRDGFGGGQVGMGDSRDFEQMIRKQDRHGCKVFVKNFEENEVESIEATFMRMRPSITNLISTELRIGKIIKFGIVLIGSFVTLDEDGNEKDKVKIPMRTSHRRMFLSDEHRIRILLNRSQKQAVQTLEGIEQAGSGWVLKGVSQLYLEVGKCNLVGGARPKRSRFLNITHGQEFLIDVDTDDNLCFANSFAQHFIKKHDVATTKAWIYQNLNLENMIFPMSLQKIATFERRHKHLNTAINVFVLEGRKCYPVHKSISDSIQNCANLLLVPFVEDGEKNYHYIYIRDLDKFLSAYQNQLGLKREKTYKHCINCLSSFSTKERLEEHQIACLKNEAQLITLPNPEKKLKFENHMKAFGHEFIGFADFESISTPFEREDNVKCENCRERGDISLCKHATSVLNTQTPSCYSLVFIDREKNIVFQRTEAGEDVMPLFFQALEDAQDFLLPQLQAQPKIKLWTDEDDLRFKSATHCHVCKEKFDSELEKVRDHCHKTGKHLGAAHNKCNVNRRVKNNLLVYMHNFSGYDSHFIIKYYKELEGREKRLKGLARNTEKFRTLNLGKIHFLDSMSLLDAGLGELVGDLVRENHSFPILAASGIYKNEQQRELLIKKKGIYPYEYMTSYEVLLEKKLPPREKFYSCLRDSTVSQEDYDQALETFEAFECKNLLEYTKLYCYLDTLQLAEVMAEFMQETMRDFGLCSTNYISLPQLSFDAMLKTTGVELDYIPDKEMTLLFENAIRGGVSYVNTRLVDVEKEGGIIEYFDANNLYGKSQMEFLPMGNYKWLSEEEVRKFDDLSLLMGKPKNDPKGWVFEVDLEYPEELRKKNAHRNMPLAPEHLVIFHDDLSEYSKQCLEATTGNKNNKRYFSEKLCGTFYKKERYLVHYRNLQFYVRHGLKVTKIHRVIEFDQGDFSRPYIEFTAKKRASTKSDFKKRTAKLLSNANFGKWLQNVRKYIDVKLVTRESTATKYINSPRYISSRQLSDDITAIFLKKEKVVLDRKYSIGFTILELSKLLMYEYYYDVIVPRFGEDNVSIILSDTDSFVLHIKNHTRTEAREKMRDVMDFSNLAPTDEHFDSSRAKVPGYLKTETPTSSIMECVAPKSKCYALRSISDKPSLDENIEKKCKGISKSRVKNLKIDSYRKCIQDIATVKTDIARLQSKNHTIQTVIQNKLALSSFDDKRFLLHCGKHSVPYQREPQSNVCDICC